MEVTSSMEQKYFWKHCQVLATNLELNSTNESNQEPSWSCCLKAFALGFFKNVYRKHFLLGMSSVSLLSARKSFQLCKRLCKKYADQCLSILAFLCEWSKTFSGKDTGANFAVALHSGQKFFCSRISTKCTRNTFQRKRSFKKGVHS